MVFAEYQWPYRPTLLFLIVFLVTTCLQTLFKQKGWKLRLLFPIFSFLTFALGVLYAWQTPQIPGLPFSDLYVWLTVALPGIAALCGALVGEFLGFLCRFLS